MWKPIEAVKASASSHPKTWIAIGIGVAGIVILAETHRRRRRTSARLIHKEDFGAFLERFELLPFPQPPPPAARQSLAGLTFAINDMLGFFSFSSSSFFFLADFFSFFFGDDVFDGFVYFWILDFGFVGCDRFEVKGYLTGFGSPDWQRTHEAAGKTALVVTALLKNGATCVGRTIMDELAFG